MYLKLLGHSYRVAIYYLYADDTCIFYQDKGIHKIEDVLTKEFSAPYEWFVENKFTIDFGKIKQSAFSFLKLSVRQS